MQGIILKRKPLQTMSLNQKCKLTVSSNYAEIVVLKNYPNFKCLKLSGSTYLNQRTGEVLEYHITDDTKSLDSLRKTFKRLTLIIRDNFNGGQSEIFMTLGYNYLMHNTHQLNHDFNLLWRKLKRRYVGCAYISVAEYKGNGSLHLHLLIKELSNKRLYFDRDLIIKMWGNSDIYIERIKTSKDVEKISNYMNPFTNPKKFQRLKYYERNFRIYNCSYGIIKPKTISNISLGEAIDYLSDKGYVKYKEGAYDIVASLEDEHRIVLNSINKVLFRREEI